MQSGSAAPKQAILTILITGGGLALAGALQAASTAWPLHAIWERGEAVWGMQLLAMVLCLLFVNQSTSWKQAFVRGWLFTTVWLSATFWWLYIAMHTYAGMAPVLAALGTCLLGAALALYYAASMALYWKLSKAGSWAAASIFAAVWLFAELARGIWFTGFGWGAVGYAHLAGPLSRYAAWVGAYGMAALAAFVASAYASALGTLLNGKPLTLRELGTPVLASALLLLGYFAPLGWTTFSQGNGVISVTLLQGNIPQDEKFDSSSGVPLALEWYGTELRKPRSQIVIAPETAVPLLPTDLPPNYLQSLMSDIAQGHQAALFGLPLGSFREGYTNSAVAIRPGQTIPWRYDKHHLVPFGEFTPKAFKWVMWLMQIPLGDFERGALGQASLEWAGQRIAANICYEDLFGEELATRFVDEANAPTIFVNISNLAWFGDSLALDQHLNISKMRALEFQRPFLRATNTGATAVLDHTGHVQSALPRFSRGVLTDNVEGQTGLTPYVAWVSRFGLWPLWLLSIGIIAFAGWRGRSLRP